MSLTTVFHRTGSVAPVAVTHRAVPILLVDDNASKRLGLKAVLAPLGYTVVEADSGAAALRCLMKNDFAVILLDVRMPIMDGFETAALIRLRRQSEMTPIIFITAHQSDEIMTDRYAEGAVDFITTPVHPDELRAKVSVFANIFLQAQANAAKARELQTSADQLRLLTETAPIGIFQTDAHNRYVYTNKRWTEITGIAGADAIGQEWHRIIDDEQRATLAAGFEESLDMSEFSSRLEVRAPDGESRILLLTSKSMLDDEGGITGWVGTLADITAEAGAEAAMAEARDEATAASRLKSDFLANMSHEIRTPMNGVIGLTELLLDTDLDAQQREFALTLSKSGEALMVVINGILDFAKIEKGKLEVEDIEFSVQTIVDEVVALLAPSAQAKGLELMAVLEDSVPQVVSGDPSRLRQVLTNLTGNAIKFTHSGEVVVRATAECASAGTGATLRFELSDTGVGIAPDKLAMIFEPFTQADTSTTREYGGTGLGLAISSQLIGLMGGEVGLSSEVGTGSTFWFTVRVQAHAIRAADGPASSEVDLAGVRVLVVDDNSTQRSILSDYLSRWEMEVETAVSAAAALEKLRAAAADGRPVAVALVNTSMLRLEGVTLGSAVIDDPLLTTRLVLMTDECEIGAVTELGEGTCLAKPVRREDLLASLRTALGLPAEAGGATVPGIAPRSGESGRLLLAEDNVINQMVAVTILTNAGYQVDTARNGAEAVRAAAGQHYDVILMDCQMPQMNGYEATAAIREREGTARHTPIIALTAGARGEDRDRCLEAGMDDYVSKPMHKEPLLEMVRRSMLATPA
jgi:two-component system sensor histidine kinase/response regulator